MPLPAFARIVDARLTIVAAGVGVVSEVTRRRFAGPPATERIRLDLAMSPMTAIEARQWSAWVEAIEGRLGIVDIEMRSSLSPQPAATLVLNSAAAAGASSLVVLATGAEIPAGTMITVGAQDGSQQLVMLLEAVQPGAPATVEIAPRMRKPRAGGAPVAIGNAAIGLFRFASDEQGAIAIRAGRGVAALSLIEHVA